MSESRPPLLLRLLVATVGYGVAVLVADAVAISLWVVPTMLPDGGEFGSAHAVANELAGIAFFAVYVTVPSALPGFLVALHFARRYNWQSWRPYAFAGLLNVFPSLTIFVGFMGIFGLSPGLVLACLPGGAAGGAAYWFTVRSACRLLATRGIPT